MNLKLLYNYYGVLLFTLLISAIAFSEEDYALRLYDGKVQIFLENNIIYYLNHRGHKESLIYLGQQLKSPNSPSIKSEILDATEVKIDGQRSNIVAVLYRKLQSDYDGPTVGGLRIYSLVRTAYYMALVSPEGVITPSVNLNMDVERFYSRVTHSNNSRAIENVEINALSDSMDENDRLKISVIKNNNDKEYFEKEISKIPLDFKLLKKYVSPNNTQLITNNIEKKKKNSNVDNKDINYVETEKRVMSDSDNEKVYDAKFTYSDSNAKTNIEKKSVKFNIPIEAYELENEVENYMGSCPSGTCGAQKKKWEENKDSLLRRALSGDTSFLSSTNSNFNDNKRMSSVPGYSLYSEGDEYFIVRDSDKLKVKIYVGPHSPSQLYFIKPGVLAVKGVRRRVSVAHFKEESLRNVYEANLKIKNPGLDKEYKDAEIVIEDDFTKYNPNPDNEGLFYSKRDLGYLKKMKLAIGQRDIKSIVLTGENGTGKSFLMDEFVRGLPPTWTVLTIDTSSLMAGTGLRGSFEAKMKALIEVSKVKPIVLVADEVHAMLGAGASMPGEPDVFQQLKSSIANGQIMIVGTTTTDEFQKIVQRDGALARRFNTVEISTLDPSNPADFEELLLKLKYLAKQKNIQPKDDNFYKTIIEKSEFMLPFRNEPSRSTLVLSRIESFADEEREAGKDIKYDERLVDQVLSQLSRFKLSETELANYLRNAKEVYRNEIKGNDEVFEKLFDLTEIAWTGNQIAKGPMVRMLLGGPAAVGKSQRAIVYAKAMDLPYVYISPSYSNSDPDAAIRTIADQLKKDPFSVIILDELEKLHPVIRNTFLNLLSNEKLTVSIARNKIEAFTSFSTIIACTNAGEEQVERNSQFSERKSYVQLLRKSLGNYIVSRFPEPTSIVRIPPHSNETTQKILISRLANIIEKSKKGLFKREILLSQSEIDSIVSEVTEKMNSEGWDIRSAEAYLTLRINKSQKSILSSGSNSKTVEFPMSRNSCLRYYR